MSGLYIHIPFCRKACTYCDFHFSTALGQRDRMLDAMECELEERMAKVRDGTIGTIYFGGGTPSLMPADRIERFIALVRKRSPVEADAEITLEANPDDITAEVLADWRTAGVTRISLGIQSFRDDRLRFMGRAHDAKQARESIKHIANAGFRSWTIDLIYGLPEMTLDEWDEQLTIALDHGMPHLSAYCLTLEAKTALAHQVARGLVAMPGDEDQSAQFDRLMERMERAGLDHYEISNFGLPDHHARHNFAYWDGVPYLGIGPSAHSFNGSERRWNVANNTRYMKGIETGEPAFEREVLTAAQRTNEALLTGLRTSVGVAIDRLEHKVLDINSSAVERHVSNGHLIVGPSRLVLTKAGRHFADRIASDLFVTENDR